MRQGRAEQLRRLCALLLCLVLCFVAPAEASRFLRSSADAICAEAARTGSPTTVRACETVKALRGSRGGHAAAVQSVGGTADSHASDESSHVDAVKEAIAWAFDGYEKYAWGHDELMPLSKVRWEDTRWAASQRRRARASFLRSPCSLRRAAWTRSARRVPP